MAQMLCKADNRAHFDPFANPLAKEPTMGKLPKHWENMQRKLQPYKYTKKLTPPHISHVFNPFTAVTVFFSTGFSWQMSMISLRFYFIWKLPTNLSSGSVKELSLDPSFYASPHLPFIPEIAQCHPMHPSVLHFWRRVFQRLHHRYQEKEYLVSR